MRAIGVIAATIALALATGAQATPARVRIAQGALAGVTVDGVTSFKAIPYAAPPVGPLRWRPPGPAPHWMGVRAATAYGPECMQPDRPRRPAGMSEDCLTLNVWAPAGAKRAPVMVWIHGGGFIWGTGGTDFYAGDAFARHGVVTVTINYRLGRFGFFAHPALVAEARGGPTADYGFMDQIAALKWVKANIAAFGGDPDRVTIAGESAGAMSVNYLMTAPQARGLFEGAISESGFGRVPGKPLAKAEAAGVAVAKALGIEGDDPAAAAALRALSAEALNHPVENLLDPAASTPIVDGVLIPRTVAETFADHAEAKVPYLVGGNTWEASLLAAITANPEPMLARLGRFRPMAEQLFGAPGDDPKATVSNLLTAAAVLEPDRALAEDVTADGAPAFVYVFAYLPSAERGTRPGVPHGGEIAWVFDHLPRAPGKDFEGRPYPAADAADETIAKAVNAYWAAFVKTGDPDSAGGPVWPRFDAQTQPTMVFGDTGPAIVDRYEAPRLDFAAAIAARNGGAPGTLPEAAAKP